MGVDFTVMFLVRGNLVYPKLRGTNLVTRYGYPEVSCVIPNKSACMDDDTWAKVMKVTDTDIIKTKMRNVDLCFACFSIYITINIFPLMLSIYDT